MGSRGKKRHRADGSVATGKTRHPVDREDDYEPVAAVDPSRLAAALNAWAKHLPLDCADLAAPDEAIEAAVAAVDEVAASDAEAFALGCRVEKLAAFLRRPASAESFKLVDGEIVVSPHVLDVASVSPTTSKVSNDLPWSSSD